MIDVPRCGDLDPVAMAPDARVHREVRLAQALAVGVAPEADRHRRHRLRDHELADLADQRVAVLVERLHVAAERARLQLALVDGLQRAAADERRADVRAAARREQPRVRAELVVDPGESPRATAASPSSRRCAALPRSRPAAGLTPAFMQLAMIRRARAEARDLRLRGELPQPVERRGSRTAVVEHDRRRGQQRADEEVPHHPAGRREPEDAVVLVRVDVQVELLELLEQDPAVAVDDRLRQAGRAAGVQDPERVVERHRLEAQLAAARRRRAARPSSSRRAASTGRADGDR